MRVTGGRAFARVIDFFVKRERAQAQPGPGIYGNIDRFDGEECAGWAIDTNDVSKPLTVQVVVDGTVVHTEIANMERRDLIPVFGDANHGFAIGIDRYLKKGINHVEIVLAEGGFAFSDCRRALDGDELAALVEDGRDGFLFLRNDSNRTSDVIEGRRPLEPEQLRTLSESLVRRYRTIRESGARSMTLIVPEKGVICNAKRISPLCVSDARPAIQLRAALADQPIDVYEYATALFDAYPDPADAFLKTDTHLSNLARLDVFRHVMHRLGVAPETAHNVSTVAQFAGDLGGKLSPPKTETIERLRPIYETRKLIDDATPAIMKGTTLRGARIFHESAVDNELTCVVIGTSTAYYLREWFYANFRTLHFYWGNGVDHGFLRAARPDYVVCLASERYIGSSLEDKEIGLRPLSETPAPQ